MLSLEKPVFIQKIRLRSLNLTRRSKDKAIMLEILTALPKSDRDAILNFYVDGKTEEEIEATFGVRTDRFRELRRTVKAAFHEKRALAS